MRPGIVDEINLHTPHPSIFPGRGQYLIAVDFNDGKLKKLSHNGILTNVEAAPGAGTDSNNVIIVADLLDATFVHGLGKSVSVDAIDGATGEYVSLDVAEVSSNSVRVRSSPAFNGKLVFN